jgi:hypothetical protein
MIVDIIKWIILAILGISFIGIFIYSIYLDVKASNSLDKLLSNPTPNLDTERTDPTRAIAEFSKEIKDWFTDNHSGGCNNCGHRCFDINTETAIPILNQDNTKVITKFKLVPVILFACKHCGYMDKYHYHTLAELIKNSSRKINKAKCSIIPFPIK